MTNWNEYSMHVISELKRSNDGIEKCNNRLNSIEKDIVKLQTRSSVWGAVGGFSIAIITNLIMFLIKK